MDRLLAALEAIRTLLTPKGAWGYVSGTGGYSGTLTGKHVLSVTVYANTADVTVTINSGNTITIRSGTSWGMTPQPSLFAPTIVVSSHGDYCIETSA